MSLKREGRAPLDPFNRHFVLCDELYVDGMKLKLGDQVPDYCQLFLLHTHFDNGVVGSQKELDALLGKPVKLSYNNPLAPIARFISHPYEVKPPEERNEERGEFYMENAELLSTKADIQGYAKQFDIKLINRKNMTIKEMLANLKKQAEARGLIKE